MTKKTIPFKPRQKKSSSSHEKRKMADNPLEFLPPEIVEELKNISDNSKSPDDFIRQILVGNCPICGIDNTDDCENNTFADNCVGICNSCKALWCLECGFIFKKDQTECGHWEICEQCNMPDHEEGMCSILDEECDKIKKWKKSCTNLG
jgi:hypothetical protein